MDNTITVNSSTARNDFYDLLSAVYLNKKTVVIKKSGVEWGRIVPPNPNKDTFMSYAGFLTEKEGDRLLKLVRTGRNDGSRKKKYLANWE